MARRLTRRLLLQVLEDRTTPAVFTVTNLNSSGAGSLSQAVLDANAAAGADSINFSPGLSGTITVSGPALTISGPVAIDGTGTSLSISATAASVSRIFNIDVPGGGNNAISISNLTLINGNAGFGNGGGILNNDEALSLTRVVMSGCFANFSGAGTGMGGAVYIASTLGSLTATDCVFTNNQGKFAGGAIGGNGSVSLMRAIIAGNTALQGAGIQKPGGTLSVIDSTISGNTGIDFSGNYSAGAALFVYGPTTTTIRNTTISGNQSDFGASFLSGTVLIQNSTIAFNTASSQLFSTATGGLRIGPGQVTLESTIVANNIGKNADILGSVTANSSLIGNTAGATITGSNNKLGVDPLLGPLANNGGPTFTHRLLPGSPAINAGSNPLALNSDQRGGGFIRSVGVTDIGAYEVQAGPRILAISINGGATQRSRVTSLSLFFTGIANFPATPATAFELKRQSDGAIVNTSVSINGNAINFTFTGGAVDSGSLADGRYTLTAFASQIGNADAQLDGNGDGIPGDDYVLIGDPATNKLFRLFGDADGSGIVDGVDFGTFRTAFNTNDNIFDFDNNGVVDGLDFGQFRMRFGVMI